MKIKNSKLQFPILLNLVLIGLLYGDYALPSRAAVGEKFDYFRTAATTVASYKGGGGTSISNYIECRDGSYYRIARLPDYADTLKSGEDIYIEQTLLLGKLKAITSGKVRRDISFLWFPEILAGFALALLVTLVNVVTDRIPDFFMGFVSVFVYMVSMGYLLFLS